MEQQERIIGVGPHPLPWPKGEQYDSELLAQGDKRNVITKYRYWTVAAIAADLAESSHELHIAIENWQHDNNIGTIVRTANAFNVAGVHIIGKRHWNRRGAMVTDRYLAIQHHATVADFIAAIGDREVVAVDNLPGASNLSQLTLPQHCVLVFGGEGPGLSPEMQAHCRRMVKIEQFGSTRSVNIGVAAGIVMYEWVRQQVLTK